MVGVARIAADDTDLGHMLTHRPAQTRIATVVPGSRIAVMRIVAVDKASSAVPDMCDVESVAVGVVAVQALVHVDPGASDPRHADVSRRLPKQDGFIRGDPVAADAVEGGVVVEGGDVGVGSDGTLPVRLEAGSVPGGVHVAGCADVTAQDQVTVGIRQHRASDSEYGSASDSRAPLKQRAAVEPIVYGLLVAWHESLRYLVDR